MAAWEELLPSVEVPRVWLRPLLDGARPSVEAGQTLSTECYELYHHHFGNSSRSRLR